MTITQFLEARISEDEERASSGWSHLREARWDTNNYGQRHLTPVAVAAECKAKLAIIDLHSPIDPCDAHDGQMNTVSCDTLRALAAIYADHPDYKTEWEL